MLNPERVDRVGSGEVEIEFTTESAHHGVTIIIDERDAMRLAHMIMDECSYAAQLKREGYQTILEKKRLRKIK